MVKLRLCTEHAIQQFPLYVSANGSVTSHSLGSAYCSNSSILIIGLHSSVKLHPDKLSRTLLDGRLHCGYKLSTSLFLVQLCATHPHSTSVNLSFSWLAFIYLLSALPPRSTSISTLLVLYTKSASALLGSLSSSCFKVCRYSDYLFSNSLCSLDTSSPDPSPLLCVTKILKMSAHNLGLLPCNLAYVASICDKKTLLLLKSSNRCSSLPFR